MPLADILRTEGDIPGFPTKKQKMKLETPLKHYLRALIEEHMTRQQEEMQAQQMQQQMPMSGTQNVLQRNLLGVHEEEPSWQTPPQY